MNWLEQARREIAGHAEGRTANTAEGNPTAVTAVPATRALARAAPDDGAVGPPWHALTDEDLRMACEERAAILEFDGGLRRADAERESWRLMAVGDAPKPLP
jgi:hypothetical protein